jgi:hypothetical protein
MRKGQSTESGGSALFSGISDFLKQLKHAVAYDTTQGVQDQVLYLADTGAEDVLQGLDQKGQQKAVKNSFRASLCQSRKKEPKGDKPDEISDKKIEKAGDAVLVDLPQAHKGHPQDLAMGKQGITSKAGAKDGDTQKQQEIQDKQNP